MEQPVQLCLRCSHSNLNHRGHQDSSYPCIIGGCSCANFRIVSIKPPKVRAEKVGKFTVRNK